jgi:GT2 family glycosyltransferase
MSSPHPASRDARALAAQPGIERAFELPTGTATAALPKESCSVALCTYVRPQETARFLRALSRQSRLPEELVIVDASPGDDTERIVRAQAARLGAPVVYVRVGEPLRGLTRQRNLALALVRGDLVAFFDDDAEPFPDCLEKMERALREDPGAVGAGGFVEGGAETPDRLWRFRRLLGIVETLTPGRYTRSGMSIPWSHLPSDAGTVEGDWLPGCAMMWRTEAARSVRFFEGFAGYAQGEDLEFSLRMKPLGRLLMVRGARVVHAPAESGRPDAARLGYMAIRNRFEIHRRGLPGRRRRDVARFVYAWAVDTALLARHLLHPGRAAAAIGNVRGRLRAALELARQRRDGDA